MDLNYFLFREQVSLMRADAAECEESRAAHLEFADGYRRRIDELFPLSARAARDGQ